MIKYFSIHHYDGSDKITFLSPIEIMDYFAQFRQFKPFKIYQRICRVNSHAWNRFLKSIHKEKISLYRILKIEYLCISRYWEIIYKKRHYGNEGHYYFKIL